MSSAEFGFGRGAGDFPALGGMNGMSGAGGIGGANGRAVPGNGAGAERFDALFQQLNREVVRYIEQGDGGTSGTVSGSAALSPEGAWGRLQAMSAFGVDGAGGFNGWGGIGGAGVIDGGINAGVNGGIDGVSDEQRQAFIDQTLPLARRAGAKLGVAPEVLTAQAALETGWGRSPIRAADGTPSHNYFGIKATGWNGAVAQAMTTEVEQGAPVARSEAFRAYASPAQSFDDLARLIGTNPRYQGALNVGADARAYGAALQRGGYATDPAYAEKLARVAARVQGASK